VRSTIIIDSSPIVLKVEALAIPFKKWKVHLLLHMMSDMFSPQDMLKFFVESECEDEPCQLGNKEFSKE
jgi:hypothetical protein